MMTNKASAETIAVTRAAEASESANVLTRLAKVQISNVRIKSGIRLSIGFVRRVLVSLRTCFENSKSGEMRNNAKQLQKKTLTTDTPDSSRQRMRTNDPPEAKGCAKCEEIWEGQRYVRDFTFLFKIDGDKK